jgi:hypothetical protein
MSACQVRLTGSHFSDELSAADRTWSEHLARCAGKGVVAAPLRAIIAAGALRLSVLVGDPHAPAASDP